VHLRSGLEGRRCDVLLHREDGRCDEEAGLGRREREGGREGGRGAITARQGSHVVATHTAT
jgi:hypothetical protein